MTNWCNHGKGQFSLGYLSNGNLPILLVELKQVTPDQLCSLLMQDIRYASNLNIMLTVPHRRLHITCSQLLPVRNNRRQSHRNLSRISVEWGDISEMYQFIWPHSHHVTSKGPYHFMSNLEFNVCYKTRTLSIEFCKTHTQIFPLTNNWNLTRGGASQEYGSGSQYPLAADPGIGRL